ncbi:MAG: 50S ribosomal protein L25 [Candidatus Komeilibacteria bacterium]|nr:50S ribosomal protein L25 [Candidatus Komeilibacteria bacterium]
MVNQEIKLSAKTRTLPTKALNEQRSNGLVPAELYGSGKPNQHLFVNKLELEKVYHQAGSSSLVDLSVDDAATFKVMVQDVQVDPLSGKLDHADLFQIEMDKEMFAHLPLVLLGESKAIKEQGGTLVTPLQEVEISCLPKDLIPHLEVDLSMLANIGDSIRVKDLKIPATIKLVTNEDEVVASAILQKFEAEAVVAPVAEAAVEGAPAEGAEAKAEGAGGAEAGKKKSEEKK